MKETQKNLITGEYEEHKGEITDLVMAGVSDGLNMPVFWTNKNKWIMAYDDFYAVGKGNSWGLKESMKAVGIDSGSSMGPMIATWSRETIGMCLMGQRCLKATTKGNKATFRVYGLTGTGRTIHMTWNGKTFEREVKE